MTLERDNFERDGKWRLDRFTPSNGTRVVGCVVDHQAEIVRRTPGGMGATYMLLQFGSHGIDTAAASEIVERVLKGLNA